MGITEGMRGYQGNEMEKAANAKSAVQPDDISHGKS